MTAPAPRRIPLVDLPRHHAALAPALRAAWDRVSARGTYLLGPETAAFEAAFAAHEGGTWAVGCGSGSDALLLVLFAWGIGPGDVVVTVANSFVATAESVRRSGAEVMFAEPDPTSRCLDPEDLRLLLDGPLGPRIRAIVPVHLYGHPADLAGVRAVLAAAGRNDVRILSDAAQAHGVPGIFSGSDAVAYSFYPGKNLGAMGDAGAIVGSDPELEDLLRRLRNHGRRGKHDSDRLGLNSRFDEIQAAVLATKLPHLRDWNGARRAHAARYDTLLSGIGPRVRRPALHRDHAFHLYVVEVDPLVRDELHRRLETEGIGAGLHYPVPVHHMPPFRDGAARRKGGEAPPAVPGASQGDDPLPRTLAQCRSVLSLPLDPYLDPADQDHVVERLDVLLAALEARPWPV